MKGKLKFALLRKYGSETSGRAWFCMKLSLAVLACVFLLYVLYHRTEQPFPTGICRWVNCSLVARVPIRLLFAGLLLGSLLLYVLEKYMRWVTLVIGLLSVLILSLEESNGNPAENGILSLLFFAQSLAYWVSPYTKRLTAQRVQFQAQFFAAAYTLAAISKLHASGLHWFTDDSPRFVLEVLRVHFSNYASSGMADEEIRGFAISGYLESHLLFTKIILATALLIELGAFCLFLNRGVATAYALLILCMHLGFYFTLGIFFPTIILPLVVVFLNPLYLLSKLIPEREPAAPTHTKKAPA